MLSLLAQDPLVDAGYDAGIVEMSTFSAHLAYATMCLSLCWGAFTSMGWVNRFTGRQALKSSHMVFATLALAFAGVHGIAFTFLRNNPSNLFDLLVPFNSSVKIPVTMGILAFEGMLVAAVAVGLKRWMVYRKWLLLHRIAYPAFLLGVGHAFVQASASGSLATLWLIGITLLVPAVTLILLRMVPAKALATTGLLEDVR